MVDNKRKRKGGSNQKNEKRDGKKSGPRLPSALRKDIEFLNPNPRNNDDEEIDSDEELHIQDVYEYDEQMPEEESKKNRRFDVVDNLEYELPEDFDDENVRSDESGDDDDDDEEDEEKHGRILQGITGMPAEAFEGKKKNKQNFILPESEFNPTQDGSGKITILDLLDPLHGQPGYNKLRKRTQQLEQNSMSVQAPLPKVEREKIQRGAAYKESKKEITKWEPIVKRNREAPTIMFDEDTDVGFSTVGAIVSEFQPRTDFEKQMASVVQDKELVDAHKNDGARLLELNMVSVEDVRERQNRLAKMRSLLFRHETKAKHIKKIKSKTFHRQLKKDRLKASSAEMDMDPEAAKELAMKQEFKRAEERMRLKHKNNSKWAKRILQRGLAAQDEGTRAAISEQLHEHALLIRKMNSMKDGSSSDDSGDDDDEDDDPSPVTDHDGAFKVLTKAKEKTLKVLEEDDDMPKSGIFSLPFMVRGMEKRKEAVEEEAKLALEQYESSLRELEDINGQQSPKIATSSGRRVFGAAKKQPDEQNTKMQSDKFGRYNDSDDDMDNEENIDVDTNMASQKNARINSVRPEDSNSGLDPLFKNFDEIVGNPGVKTTYEVSMFASNSWKKMKGENKNKSGKKEHPEVGHQALLNEDLKDVEEDSGSESGEEMVDGILSSIPKEDYKLPSQADLIRSAFAGDDVAQEFEKEKSDIVNQENPEPEKPVLVPGWGQWTHIQKKKGLPAWMREEHEHAKKKREDELKKRKDSHLKHVIISEKVDKKAAKLQVKALPFPYKSKEVFEQSLRVPVGPDFNPATTVNALIRPDVVKKSGIIIKPIEFEDVDPYEKNAENKRKGQADKSNKKRNTVVKVGKRATKRQKAN